MGVAVGPFAVGGDGVREFVVLVLSAGGGDLLEHLLHVIQERRLVLVDPDSGSRVPGKDDGEAVGDAGLPGGVFDPFRYVDKLRPLVGPDHERLREELHYAILLFRLPSDWAPGAAAPSSPSHRAASPVSPGVLPLRLSTRQAWRRPPSPPRTLYPPSRQRLSPATAQSGASPPPSLPPP